MNDIDAIPRIITLLDTYRECVIWLKISKRNVPLQLRSSVSGSSRTMFSAPRRRVSPISVHSTFKICFIFLLIYQHPLGFHLSFSSSLLVSQSQVLSLLVCFLFDDWGRLTHERLLCSTAWRPFVCICRLLLLVKEFDLFCVHITQQDEEEEV